MREVVDRREMGTAGRVARSHPDKAMFACDGGEIRACEAWRDAPMGAGRLQQSSEEKGAGRREGGGVDGRGLKTENPTLGIRAGKSDDSLMRRGPVDFCRIAPNQAGSGSRG